MSKKLKEIVAAEKAAHKEVEAAKKMLALAEKKEAKLWTEWLKSFRCKKCGLAFKVNELGYKEYEVLRTDIKGFTALDDYGTNAMYSWFGCHFFKTWFDTDLTSHQSYASSRVFEFRWLQQDIVYNYRLT